MQLEDVGLGHSDTVVRSNLSWRIVGRTKRRDLSTVYRRTRRKYSPRRSVNFATDGDVSEDDSFSEADTRRRRSRDRQESGRRRRVKRKTPMKPG